MMSKCLVFVLTFVFVLAFGIFIGYSLKPQVRVELYDPTGSIPASNAWEQAFDRSALAKWASAATEPAAYLTQLKKLRPLVEAGPFFVALNPANGDFWIQDRQENQPMAWRITLGDEILLLYNTIEPEVMVDIRYGVTDHKLHHAVYSVGGLTQPLKYDYMDNDGDGLFDALIDCKEGMFYERNGLEWVKKRDAPVLWKDGG